MNFKERAKKLVSKMTLPEKISQLIYEAPAIERLNNAPVKELVVTNTIPLPEEKQIDKVKVLSIAPLFAEAIKRINEATPLGDLFDL